MTMQWGDKGCDYRPDRCKHESDDGCEWCCMTCNLDRHWCPGCGTVSDHKNSPCDDKCADKAGMTIKPILDQSLDIEQFIGEAVGAASMCWARPEGAGEFNSTRASKIVDEIMAKLSEVLR